MPVGHACAVCLCACVCVSVAERATCADVYALGVIIAQMAGAAMPAALSVSALSFSLFLSLYLSLSLSLSIYLSHSLFLQYTEFLRRGIGSFLWVGFRIVFIFWGLGARPGLLLTHAHSANIHTHRG